MNYSKDEVLQFVMEEDVKFIRLSFTNTNGIPKNISVMPGELSKAFNEGISVDYLALDSASREQKTIVLHPDPSTFSLLPWRPDHGRVARMYCSLTNTDGTPVELDERTRLITDSEGDSRTYITECDFYILTGDAAYDDAGYMDIAPLDKCENIRREICLTLETMGITPVRSCHSFGPGQNRIAFVSTGLSCCADNLTTYITAVKTLAASSGLWADFSSHPLDMSPENICCITASDGKSISFTPTDNPYTALRNLL